MYTYMHGAYGLYVCIVHAACICILLLYAHNIAHNYVIIMRMYIRTSARMQASEAGQRFQFT